MVSDEVACNLTRLQEVITVGFRRRLVLQGERSDLPHLPRVVGALTVHLRRAPNPVAIIQCIVSQLFPVCPEPVLVN